MTILIKRAYETSKKDDGFRILVDRIWPRGVTKEAANIDLWFKDISPSTLLRKWFSHDPLKWDKFKERYIEELDNNPEIVEEFINLLQQHKRVTLVYGAKDTEHSQAPILKEYMEKKLKE
ncbi:DUF488 domain-containing protein [Sulfurimonas sp.]|jgi:uncharacterized protein YeaO (DUF488 family)|uniref:DUF488 domain-containing protein n=1 Tax=Sulfurimonas sp. TaxID=2022749 RepID=UPI0025E88389|nr:DUF488 domain-containing protein [Sulfurimonas sp.]MCK9473789.1 DUF488 domain-containing protein [Sulfurimonas sp.]MDD3505452.1 DUF488 domain-containing protein [Sulfurimonas sp.]